MNVSLPSDLVKRVVDRLTDYDDCGPPGEGWQSELLMSDIAAMEVVLSAQSTGSGGVAAEPVAQPSHNEVEEAARVIEDQLSGVVPTWAITHEAAVKAARIILAAAPTPPAEPAEGQELAHIRAMLSADQGDDDGSQILPDFDEGMSVVAMVSRCVHLLEQRRDVLDAYKLKATAAPTPPAGGGETDAVGRKAREMCAKVCTDASGELVSEPCPECTAHVEHDWRLDAAEELKPSPASAAGDLNSLSAGAPKGPYRVEYTELGEGPDTRPIAFLMGPNDEHLLVDEDPKDFVDGAPSPILTYLAELDAAYRSGRLVEAAPVAPLKGPSASDLIKAIYKNVSAVTAADGKTWVDYAQVQEVITALLTPADRGETQAVGTTFAVGERVRKTKGSSWQGRVCGFYSTDLTPSGICVESEREPGSVQIYPASALEALTHPSPDQNRGEPDQGVANTEAGR